MTTLFPRFPVTAADLPEITLRAEQGDPTAQLRLATLLHHGILGKRDLKLATHWVQRAAQAGDLRAMATLAWCLDVGSGVRASAKDAFSWLHQAAEAGDAASAYGVAMAFRDGRGVKKDLATAARWLERAAEQADAAGDAALASQSWLVLGLLCCEGGRGLKADGERGERALAAAAERGNANACCALARRLAASEDGQRRAAELYGRAAEQGHPEGAAQMAHRLVRGEGIERDPVRGAAWARVAAAHRDAESQLLLARLYLNGDGVSPNEHRALFWFLRAAAGQMYRISDEARAEADALTRRIPQDQVAAVEALAAQWTGTEPEIG